MTEILRFIWLDTRLNTVELARMPAYVIPTLLLPVMLYAFFGLPYSNGGNDAAVTLGSYAAFAVIGVALFQFGVGIAVDRASPWESYLRTLPIPSIARFASRIASALIFAGASASLVAIAGATIGHAAVAPLVWLRLAAALVAGAIVFGTMGIAIGYWTGAKASVPIANVIYLMLAFVGGLWIPPSMLPAIVAPVSPFTPTRQYGEIVWASMLGKPWPVSALFTLAIYAVVFFAIAWWGYRRNETQRYR
jgi:ABC-2 type transport system permease protein